MISVLKDQKGRSFLIMMILSLLLIWNKMILFIVGITLLFFVELFVSMQQHNLSKFKDVAQYIVMLTFIALGVFNDNIVYIIIGFFSLLFINLLLKMFMSRS
ncbi:hypothetical protein D7Z54_18975 [Salibacterium salarium]|uniref:Uncharacterized protein n=1 Tax=Salibacterium salarium TaxID=284579 RepID=A0A428N040_9BACI|nr:hypothetical protein D7Z54_18975 [Salibacterium salarium]